MFTRNSSVHAYGVARITINIFKMHALYIYYFEIAGFQRFLPSNLQIGDFLYMKYIFRTNWI